MILKGTVSNPHDTSKDLEYIIKGNDGDVVRLHMMGVVPLNCCVHSQLMCQII